MTDKARATLTLRCPEQGHALIEVVWEGGKAYAHTREQATRIVRGDDGQPKAIPSMRQRDRVDLEAEAGDAAIVTVLCKCGSRVVALAPLYDLVKSGRTGVAVADSPLIA